MPPSVKLGRLTLHAQVEDPQLTGVPFDDAYRLVRSAVVGIQLGFSVTDVTAKCVVGLIVSQINAAKCEALKTYTARSSRGSTAHWCSFR